MTIFTWYARHAGEPGYILASEHVAKMFRLDDFARKLGEQGFTDVQLLFDEDVDELDEAETIEVLETSAGELGIRPALWSGPWLPVYSWERGPASAITKQAARRLSELIDEEISDEMLDDALADPAAALQALQALLYQIGVEFPDADLEQVDAIMLGCDSGTRPA